MKVQEQTKDDNTGQSVLQELSAVGTLFLTQHSTTIQVDPALFPYLADHGFQDMVVLPGSYYIQLASRIHVESLQASVGSVKRATFQNPILLPDSGVTLSVEARLQENQTVQYTFREAGAKQISAVLEIECRRHGQVKTAAADFSVQAFQRRAALLGGQDDYYRRLAANGNQYGPRFQNLQQIWQCGEEILGRLCVNRNDADADRDYLDPIFIDGVVQVLPGLFLNEGRTFILNGIGELTLFQDDLPDDAWVYARLRPKHERDVNERIGDVDVFDNSSACRLQLRGVRFTHLDRTEPKKDAETSKTQIVVASTFTAEPVRDPLEFWGDYFGLPVQASFAPYNQVFQELLDPSSQMRRNKDGVNAVLLNLGDWVADGRLHHLKIGREKAAACFGNHERHTLPNGLEIAHLNRHETEYVYKEIFSDRSYLRHGIRLPANATVIDIGANIGLFSLFVRSQCPEASVYSYEPSPIAFQALRANCKAYGPNLHAFNAGVSGQAGSATFTVYGQSSVFSSFRPSVEEDRKTIEAVIANMVRSELGNTTGPVGEYVEELMANRLDRQTFECRLVSVPDILRANNLKHVDLLKVDAEKCELEILQGIDGETWRLIDQVVVEVHDRAGSAVEEVLELLARQGFQCAVEEEKLLAGSGLFNVYARRHIESQNSAKENSSEPMITDLQNKIDQFAQAMDSFTHASDVPVILCLCPTAERDLSGGKVDQELAASEKYLLAKVRELPNVQVIGPDAILAHYQTTEFHDPLANQLGHVPYTPEGFAAIGSSLFRALTSLRRAPYKVIALDCDNTLWRGVCGEEGPLGVEVSASHRRLQEFMVQQMAAGMLLCVCSKNNRPDVEAVFGQNPNMVLKRGHIATWRVNWSAKSENLRSVARELNVGLDSFIFVDDNPVECAEVRAQCPEVLTLQLPPDADQWPQFLDHVWAFDHLHATREDRTRTQKVLENIEREKYREQVPTLKNFIDGLQLQVELFTPQPDQFSRVSQLTQRTNQFNCTNIRRSERDILQVLEKRNARCLAVSASDRFGDYGMVGVVIYFEERDGYDVETFLLSCRVLGRGVEHQALSQFGKRALEQGKQWAQIHFRPTNKNQPAWEFIKGIGSEFMQAPEKETIVQFPAEKLASLCYNPDSSRPSREDGQNSDFSGHKSKSRSTAAAVESSRKFQQIAVELNNVKTICRAVESHTSLTAGHGGGLRGEELPSTLAGKILGIWRRAIGNLRIGMNDNFFEAGGSSLKAVQVVATIRRELNLHLSIVNIFECPTVGLLSEKLEQGKTAKGSVNAAIERGARRRKQLSQRTGR
jgi:FkbH-like protein/FkbM family methyltransferase